jgi:hypothetical protein
VLLMSALQLRNPVEACIQMKIYNLAWHASCRGLRDVHFLRRRHILLPNIRGPEPRGRENGRTRDLFDRLTEQILHPARFEERSLHQGLTVSMDQCQRCAPNDGRN